MNTDSIEKQIVLRAPLNRVWRALSNHEEFGTWFGVRFDKPFAPGAALRAVMVGTTVDPKMGEIQKNHAGITFDIVIDRIEPERLFSFRWHPHAIDPTVDYSGEPMTLVAFVLEPVPEGVQLTVTESGFDTIPLARRAKAFTANGNGWGLMVECLNKYVTNA